MTEFSPEEMAKLREKSKSVVEKHAAAADPAVTKLLYAELEKARGKN